ADSQQSGDQQGDAQQASAAQVKPGDQGDGVFALQVALDRAGFSPGVIDGHYGPSTKKAVAAFQEGRNLETTGLVDDRTAAALKPEAAPATVSVTVDQNMVGTIGGPIPAKPEDAAALKALPYGSFEEALAERYHTTAKALKTLNPDAQIVPGATLTL